MTITNEKRIELRAEYADASIYYDPDALMLLDELDRLESERDEARAQLAECEEKRACDHRRRLAAEAQVERMRAKCAELRALFNRQAESAGRAGNTEAVGLRGDRLGVVASIEAALADVGRAAP